MNFRHPLYLEEMNALAALNLPFEAFRAKTVAVTGAGGLVGGALLRGLEAVNRVHGLNMKFIALGRRPGELKAQFAQMEKLQCLPWDAREALLPPFSADFIVHAASNAHPLAFSKDPVGTMQANILGVMGLLERSRETGGRFLFLSTGEIYGERPEWTGGFDETSFGAVNPMTARACYPESKRAGETLCAAYNQQYGVDALVARLTYTYGPGITDKNSRADAQFLRRALAGEDIILKSAGAQIRSYCYVQDAAAALILLLLKGERGEAYNVSDPDSTATIREYAQTLAELAGVHLKFDLPPEEERRGYSQVSRAVLNPAKLLSLGWKPQYPLREGLRRTLLLAGGK